MVMIAPTTEHDPIIDLFRERPESVADLLSETLRVPLPAYERAEVGSADFTQTRSMELRADSVVVFYGKRQDGDFGPVLATVAEVQRKRDPRKHWTWPMYLISLRTRMRCPAILLVISPVPAVARWGARPIDLGRPGPALTPLVAGPGQVPVITDPEEAAADLALATLSAIVHAGTAHLPAILDALLAAIEVTDPENGHWCFDRVEAALSTRYWRKLMSLMEADNRRRFLGRWARYHSARGQAEGRAEGRIEGRAEGKIEARVESILTVLRGRGLEVPEEVRAAIGACTDLDRLDAWLQAAVTAASARELLDIGD